MHYFSIFFTQVNKAAFNFCAFRRKRNFQEIFEKTFENFQRIS